MKGAYILIIRLDRERTIRVGKRRINFRKGFYCYVGSAMNSIEKRIERHKRKNKKMHWHIDYLLKHSRIVGVKMFKSRTRNECRISKQIAKKADRSVDGFGCSDCKCKSHLHYFRKNSYPFSCQYG